MTTEIPMNARALNSVWDVEHKQELVDWANQCNDHDILLVVADDNRGLKVPHIHGLDELHGPFRIEATLDPSPVKPPRRSFADMDIDEVKTHIYGWCETADGDLVILKEILGDDPMRIVLVTQTDLNVTKDCFQPSELFSRPDIPRIMNAHGRFIAPEN